MTEPTVIAIDWSGAKTTTEKSGIWLAVVRSGHLVESRAVSSRAEAIAYVQDHSPPVVAGFDFSFGLPQWFARAHGCTTIDEVWALAARDGERWLAPTPPFWRTRCEVPLDQRFRKCEARYPTAKSVFQLVGNGQVGAGSVRGMPLIARLRTGGVAIWPFDPPGDRTAFEIYPSALRSQLRHDRTFDNDHERDAVSSARVMWDHRETVAALRAATDPTTRLEGDIWAPTASPGAIR